VRWEEILRPGGAPPILLEAASWVNQMPSIDTPVRAEIRARTRDEVAAFRQARHRAPRFLIGAPDHFRFAVTGGFLRGLRDPGGGIDGAEEIGRSRLLPSVCAERKLHLRCPSR
jgi:hypothetical protein